MRTRVFAALLVALCAGNTWALATFDAIKSDFQPSDTQVLDRQGELLQRVRTDATVRRGQWVALADVSPALRHALLLSEDKRFYEHSGVDWQAATAAAWGNLWNQRTRGASTITMQLAGLLDGEGRPAGGRSMVQKIGQTLDATLLERSWRKDQVLEAYLNLVPFRGELVGIDALSRTLFGKAAHGLDAREAAVAAALVRAPNANVRQVTQRACGVLGHMQTQGQKLEQTRPAGQGAKPPPPPDCDALDMFATAALQRRAFDASEGVAPHAARQALREARADTAAPGGTSGATLRTTLHAPLQRFAVQTLTQHLRELQGRHVEDGAIVVLDNRTGEVLAWVGSSGALSRASEVDAVLAQRQPGSTLKPFLYGQAIAEQRLTAASLLEDSAAHIPTASGLYIPQNYDRSFKGWVSARTALAASLNVPAVRTLVMVSPDAFFRQLQQVGLPLRESGDYYGYSLALGSPEVSLLALTNSYRTLANGGRASGVAPLVAAGPVMVGQGPAKSRPVPLPKTVQAIDARAAFIVGDILSDPNARARTFGTDSVLATRFWTAVKTGTSKDMRDNWAMGWSQHYTVGVWVGNASGAPMWDVSGTSGAAPIWAAVVQHLHARLPSRAPAPPPGLVQAQVQFGHALEAPRSEWFLQGTQQPVFAIDSVAKGGDETGAKGQKGFKNQAAASSSTSDSTTARITEPTTGTIIALDPDIPPNRQRLRLAAEGQNLRWRIDGKDFAKGNQAQWLPWPGRHNITLVDGQGRVLDEVRVEVRGAGVR